MNCNPLPKRSVIPRSNAKGESPETSVSTYTKSMKNKEPPLFRKNTKETNPQ
jgi:hypothetical protein